MAAAPDASSASACCISAQNCCSADGCAVGLALSRSAQMRPINGCGSTPGRLPRAPPVQVASTGGRHEPEGRRRPAANAVWLVLSANAILPTNGRLSHVSGRWIIRRHTHQVSRSRQGSVARVSKQRAHSVGSAATAAVTRVLSSTASSHTRTQCGKATNNVICECYMWEGAGNGRSALRGPLLCR